MSALGVIALVDVAVTVGNGVNPMGGEEVDELLTAVVWINGVSFVIRFRRAEIELCVPCAIEDVKMLDDLVSNPYSMARIQNYDTLRDYYLSAVDSCIDGITEIFLHPALPSEEMGPEWQKRVFEYELLRSGDLLERAKKRDVRVVSWDIFSQKI